MQLAGKSAAQERRHLDGPGVTLILSLAYLLRTLPFLRHPCPGLGNSPAHLSFRTCSWDPQDFQET